MTLTPGTCIGAYEIIAALGAGGMGEVYRARDTKLAREVAVKILPAGVSERPDALARFEREAKAVAALSHPNILAIHDFGIEGGTAFAVMELLEGESLRDALAAGPLPVRRVLDYAIAIAHGLSAAHDKGIVHRDLKPENIFVTADSRIKILDFGLARQDAAASAAVGTIAPTVNSPTEPGTVLGTVGYMAPEQARGASVDWRADIFAFGAVLFEMITGRRAFLRDTAAETMTAILREDPPDEIGMPIPPALDRIVRHCLEKKPEARFRSAHDLAFALETMANTSSSGSRAVMVDDSSSGARPRWRRTAIAVALVASVGALGIAAGRRTKAAAPSGSRTEPPTFRQMTFSRGSIFGARFASDGRTIVYGAGRSAGTDRLFLARLDSVGATPLAVEGARLFSISPNDELAVGLVADKRPTGSLSLAGTLAQGSMLGGALRSTLENVMFADWGPNGSLAVVRVVGSRERLEYPIGTVLFETDGDIGHPRVAPAGDRVAFLEWPVKRDDRGTVAIVDRHGVRTTISRVWESLENLAWTPDGAEVWYTAAHTGAHYSLWAAAPGRAERRVFEGPAGFLLEDISRDGRVLLSRFDRTTAVVAWHAGDVHEHELSWLDLSFARDISADGSRVLLALAGEGTGHDYDVYVCGIDGRGATKIGEGQPQQFSPDGRSVLSIAHGPPSRVLILPMGAGDSHVVPMGDITAIDAHWLRSGRQILVVGAEPNKRQRAYVVAIDGSGQRAVSPEGVTYQSGSLLALAPDDSRVALRAPDGRVMLYPLDGGDPVPVNGLAPDEMPVGWTGDGRGLVLKIDAQEESASARMVRLDPVTGFRQTLINVSSGQAVDRLSEVLITPDGRGYVRTSERLQMTLFLAEGLK